MNKDNLSIEERQLKVLKAIYSQTEKTAKNTAFITWIIIIGLVLSVAIGVINT